MRWFSSRQRASRRSGRQARHLAQSMVLEETGPSVLIRASMLLICLLVVAFLVWAGLTPVKEVAVAPGEVVPSSDLQVIQHKEGGIVREVLVQKGQLVEQGTVLARLDPVENRSALERLEVRRVGLHLKQERLRAFAEGREPDFSFAPDRFAGLVAEQWRIFTLQREEAAATRQMLASRLERARRQAEMVTGEQESLRSQIGLLEQQREMRRELVALGLSSRLTFLEVERELERMRGEVERLSREAAVGREEQEELRTQLAQHQAQTRHDALDAAGEVSRELAETEQLIAAERARLDRLEVTAPVRGVIQDVRVRTPGAVIQPGASLMILVPLGDTLIVEARISPRDVGHVAVGQPVSVKLTAYDYARYGAVPGRLADVSPSTFVDEPTGDTYYRGFVALDQGYVGDRPESLILPGMTATADIVTGRKTLLAYLLKPVYIALTQAFRER